MPIELSTPDVAGLVAVTEALREWQRDDVPLQLHPGDLGWFFRYGPERTAAATRTWTRDGRIVGVGIADEPDLIRMTVAPDLLMDADLATQVADDLADPGRGILGEGEVYVEAPNGAVIRDVLSERGWTLDERWTPLSRNLSEPVEDPRLQVEVVGPELAATRAELQRASFEKSRFSADSWHAMAGGVPYADARCLLGYDEAGAAVATVTVWSAGPGKPGLIEPMGVHRDHRGHGYGRAICLAAAANLRGMGSTSVQVCTPSSLVGAVATYVSAGFEKLPERRDLARKE
ncbi:hypothetical protein GCM10011492_28730 [Flexivirga endophytica]|uniref:N-acetyltransferase domain-containing protein n=1 Tax=Flexivirga endophytica TaxID=1849103 RepID=A0A916WWW0_9MICO|nr:GNAT family N-acetyltransferase [Flexivirga endophytica]GGB36246.1 hypothetical protein GCM10011492_28730 [Flexivirga endophytica]GHB43988.1 hypothetical protein GCM10008112_11110 [Flexivirga endophytica]